MNHQQQYKGGKHNPTPTELPKLWPFPNPPLQQINQCANPGLLFDRYVRFQADWMLGEYATDPQGKRKRSAKLWNLEQISDAQNKRCATPEWQALHQAFIQRWRETALSQGAALCKMTPEWRFITGLGAKTALEVGFTFHRLYGFPIIPGSGLKGLTRMAALFEIAEMLSIEGLGLQRTRELLEQKQKTPFQKLEIFLLANDERMQESTASNARVKERLLHEEQQALVNLKLERGLTALESNKVTIFRRIFGTQYAEGEIVFLDAVPAELPTLEVDVMNPHFPEYYQNNQFPTDSQSPRPVFFLTVGQTPFWFAVGRRSQVGAELQTIALNWLKYGLTKLGAGAKTAAGYGYFVEVA
ncbi:MAG: type III-B CRISPR module RAMP protein Cmr6 [Anaerolineae bacterium]|nr:type III-B CRISPR module RAMP protein Cmr6 [Anaerolineae bacterium]